MRKNRLHQWFGETLRRTLKSRFPELYTSRLDLLEAVSTRNQARIECDHAKQRLLMAEQRIIEGRESLARTITELEAFQAAQVRSLEASLLRAQERITELEGICGTDLLTGLASEYAMRLLFTAEVGALSRDLRQLKERRKGPVITVMMFDLDHFKHANDSQGHAFGDFVLRIVAQLMRRHLGRRPGDILVRLHGDEFAVVLPQATPKDAAERAEEFLGAMRCDKRLQFVLGQPGITASIGIARTNLDIRIPSDEVLTALLKEADQALYRAKEQGRNRVVISGDITQWASFDG